MTLTSFSVHAPGRTAAAMSRVVAALTSTLLSLIPISLGGFSAPPAEA
jgi:hypothetical protein